MKSDKERKGGARANVLANVAQEGHWSRRNVVFASTALTVASALGVLAGCQQLRPSSPRGEQHLPDRLMRRQQQRTKQAFNLCVTRGMKTIDEALASTLNALE